MRRGPLNSCLLVLAACIPFSNAAWAQGRIVDVGTTGVDLDEFISDYETKCAARFDGPGNPKKGCLRCRPDRAMLSCNTMTPKTPNGSMQMPVACSKTTCSMSGWSTADEGETWVECDQTSTFRHEMMHALCLHHSDGGAAAIGSESGGYITFGEITETNCGQIDHRAGPPNYDSEGNPSTPILLDTGGRPGIFTSGVDDPVLFDLDADGQPNAMTWAAPGRGQAFLAIDLSGDGEIGDGSELFGSGTFLIREGIQAANGSEALAQYDQPALGGNGDGVIDASDLIWPRLRLWQDVNHDALSRAAEIGTLDDFGVVALELDFVVTDTVDEHGNWHGLRGYYIKRSKIRGQWLLTRELMEDVYLEKVE